MFFRTQFTREHVRCEAGVCVLLAAGSIHTVQWVIAYISAILLNYYVLYLMYWEHDREWEYIRFRIPVQNRQFRSDSSDQMNPES